MAAKTAREATKRASESVVAAPEVAGLPVTSDGLRPTDQV